MKRQKLEQDKLLKKVHKVNSRIIIPLLWGIIVVIIGCKQGDIEKINEITSEISGPSHSWTDSELVYSENGIIKTKITAPITYRYLDEEEPYMEFPEGLYVEFYDSLKNVESTIKSNYAIYKENESIWIAENDVEAINQDGDILNTEYLVWNMREKNIHSDRYVRITEEDGIVHGIGFTAKQDLSNWRILKPTGTINIKNEN